MRIFPKVRPYWHVDAKWICGLFLVFTMGATLLFLALANITNEDRAPKVGALIIGSAFIRGSSVDTEEARKALAENGGVIRPLPNVPSVKITEADLKLSPGEISIKVFKPITDSIYQDGLDAAAEKFASTEKQRDKFKKDAAIFNLFTRESHQTFSKLFTIFALISLGLALAVVYFSTGWGRLSNLGFLVVLVSLPGALLSLMLLNPPKDGDGGFNSLPPELADELGQAFGTYSKVAVFGVLLLVAAVIGKIASILLRRRLSSPQK